ncbi:Killing trait [Caulobacter sp. AP07]|uniref:hypothetical protein n=1 Tax=Caulobacter sp. AP07 TaxID=1144304 RepID=UPI0002720690|nr:hypothetical protein [Caulobacter sp. AP07]EJL34708.1 Killing trait [Caulobacter sp. AP07]
MAFKRSPEAPPEPPAGNDPMLDGVLKAASAQAAGLALLNAVQHLQRTTVLVEAAMAASLVRALRPGADPDDWSGGLRASQQAMRGAIEAFQEVSAVVGDLTGAARS